MNTIQEITQSISTAAAVAQSMLNDLEYDRDQLNETKANFERLVAEGAGDDALADEQEYIEERTRVLHRSEARHKAAVADLERVKAKTKADAGTGHAEAARAAADDIGALLVEFGEQGAKLVSLSEAIYRLVPDLRQNVIAARQHGVTVEPFHLSPPDLAAFQRAALVVGRIGINTTVL